LLREGDSWPVIAQTNLVLRNGFVHPWHMSATTSPCCLTALLTPHCITHLACLLRCFPPCLQPSLLLSTLLRKYLILPPSTPLFQNLKLDSEEALFQCSLLSLLPSHTIKADTGTPKDTWSDFISWFIYTHTHTHKYACIQTYIHIQRPFAIHEKAKCLLSHGIWVPSPNSLWPKEKKVLEQQLCWRKLWSSNPGEELHSLLTDCTRGCFIFAHNPSPNSSSHCRVPSHTRPSLPSCCHTKCWKPLKTGRSFAVFFLPKTRGVSHTVALLFTLLKSMLRQKKNYGNSKYFTMQICNLQNNPLKQSQNPSRYNYNSVTNLKFQHKPKCHLSKILM
jgi:hypothetical protein